MARIGRGAHSASTNEPAVRCASRGSGVQELAEQIGALVHERQQMRASGASPASLEQNRLQLADSQRALSHALVEQHQPR